MSSLLEFKSSALCLPISFSVTSQHFEVDIIRESVIIGNDAIFKCSAPSFIADFILVDSWVDSEGNVLNSVLSGNSTRLMNFPLGLTYHGN